MDRASPSSVSDEVHEAEVQKRARRMEEVQKMYEKAHCNTSKAQQQQKKGYQ